MSLHLLLLVLATGLNGLLAGLYFAFGVAVMPGLARTDDRTFVAAMAWINVRIVNGWFLAVFLGAPLSALAAAVLAVAGQEAAPGWAVAGAVAALAALLITGRCNVPLNNALAAAGPEGTGGGTEPAAVRAAFEAPWVRWHLIRTVLSVAALAALLAGLAAAAG
jgi:uncharacterized membrane protein